MEGNRDLFIPVILGTPRQGRMSEAAARLVHSELAKRDGVATEFIDIRELNLPTTDAGETAKEPGFSALVDRLTGL